MNRKLKKNIKTAFNPPAPTNKNDFLRTLNFPKASYKDFICCQIGYIRKRVWLSSFLLLFFVLSSLYFLKANNIYQTVWFISSILPFIALIGITEIARSSSYNMQELEMSCKHSFQDIILARLGILGVYNFILFILLLLLMLDKTDYNFIRLGIYMLVPFLLTCTLAIFILNHIRCRETTYICGAVSCFISILNGMISSTCQIIFAEKFLYLWAIILCILIFSIITQTNKLLKISEELIWNSPLTD